MQRQCRKRTICKWPSKVSTIKLVEDYTQKGIAFFKNGDYQSAINAFTEALALDSRDVKCLASRAAAWIQTKNYTAATQDCDKGLSIIDAEEDILKNEFKGQDGLESLRKSHKLKMLVRRGTANWELGNKSGAESDYLMALSLDPENQELKRDMEQIKQQ